MQVAQNTAIISGGASGMGAATARLLAEKGARVAILDRNIKLAEQVATEINGLAVAVDVTNETSVADAVNRLSQELGTPRICVNCAGIISAGRIVGKEGPMPLASFQEVINVNLIGTFNVLRVAAGVMSRLQPLEKSGECGVIINTASVAAFEGQIGQAAYSASKGGIVALTLPAARELAKFGIRVMAIAPGLIDTPMLKALPDKVRDSLAAGIPFPKRFGQPEEFAQLALHIIENPMLNGSVIRLDGALRMPAK